MSHLPDSGDDDSSGTIPDSLVSTARSRLKVDSRVETLKTLLTEETEAFAMKLLQVVREFLRKTSTTIGQIKAMIRCLLRCIENLNTILLQEGFEVDNSVPQPEADDSDAIDTDEQRQMSVDLLEHLKSHTLEYFLTTLDPDPTDLTDDAMRVLTIMRREVRNCDVLMDRVRLEGYDCRQESSDEEAEDSNDH